MSEEGNNASRGAFTDHLEAGGVITGSGCGNSADRNIGSSNVTRTQDGCKIDVRPGWLLRLGEVNPPRAGPGVGGFALMAGTVSGGRRAGDGGFCGRLGNGSRGRDIVVLSTTSLGEILRDGRDCDFDGATTVRCDRFGVDGCLMFWMALTSVSALLLGAGGLLRRLGGLEIGALAPATVQGVRGAFVGGISLMSGGVFLVGLLVDRVFRGLGTVKVCGTAYWRRGSRCVAVSEDSSWLVSWWLSRG